MEEDTSSVAVGSMVGSNGGTSVRSFYVARRVVDPERKICIARNRPRNHNLEKGESKQIGYFYLTCPTYQPPPLH